MLYNKKIILLTLTSLFLIIVLLSPNICSLSLNSFEKNNSDGKINRYAILIGAPAYYTDNNVNGFSNVLTNGGWNEDNIYTLIHEEVTVNAIFEMIDLVKSLEDDEDIILFYYTGHGGRDGKLILDEENETILSGEKIRDEFTNFESNNLVFIFDSCFSGSMIPIFSSEFNNRQCVVFASTHERRWASTDPNLEKGVFTHFLLESLEKKILDTNINSWISIEETFDYVKKKTQDFTDHGLDFEIQHPQSYDSSDDKDIDITRNGIKTKTYFIRSKYARFPHLKNFFEKIIDFDFGLASQISETDSKVLLKNTNQFLSLPNQKQLQHNLFD